MSKRKWKKQVKEGWTNMSYPLWKLMEYITKILGEYENELEG